VAADASGAFLVHETAGFARVPREHDEPLFVEDAEMLDSFLFTDILYNVAKRFPVRLEHCIAGGFYYSVRQVGFMGNGDVDHVGFHDRIEEETADYNETCYRYRHRDYSSGGQCPEHVISPFAVAPNHQSDTFTQKNA
jgi:hypothetical protein